MEVKKIHIEKNTVQETLIIPTYMNRNERGGTSAFASAVGKAGADFKQQFTAESYRRFFLDAGYRDVRSFTLFFTPHVFILSSDSRKALISIC